MHGAIVSRPWLIDGCTTGAARSTSQVVNMMFAPSLISFAAQALESDGLSPCVLQVLRTILRPPTPFLLTLAISSFAAASAGASNGFIGPPESPSYAQPMTIGFFPAAERVRAAAVAARTSAKAATITSAQRARLLTLMFLLSGPRPQPGPSFSTMYS